MMTLPCINCTRIDNEIQKRFQYESLKLYVEIQILCKNHRPYNKSP